MKHAHELKIVVKGKTCTGKTTVARYIGRYLAMTGISDKVTVEDDGEEYEVSKNDAPSSAERARLEMLREVGVRVKIKTKMEKRR